MCACVGVFFVANKQRKATKGGVLARAQALARKVVQKGKNVAKNKALRRVMDDVLINPGSLVAIPGMGAASAMYSKVKAANRSSKKSAGSNASPCIKKWFTCLTEPFSPQATGACIPTGANHPSMRNFGYARFDAAIGTGGFGLVAFSPSPCNDNPVIFYSDNTFAGTTDLQLVSDNHHTFGGINTLNIGNNRFTMAQLTTDLANPAATARLVGGGFRVQYTGKNINLGGLIYVYTAPSHVCVVDNPDYSIGTIGETGSYQECVIKPVTREPTEFILSPMEDRELSYPLGSSVNTHAYPWSVGDHINGVLFDPNDTVPVGACTTVCIFTGTPGETFHFEYGMHVESIGMATEGQRFPADSDPVGVDAMMAAISNAVIEIASSRKDFAPTLRATYAQAIKMGKHSARL